MSNYIYKTELSNISFEIACEIYQMEFETLFVKLQYPKLKKIYVSRKLEIYTFMPKYNNAACKIHFI